MDWTAIPRAIAEFFKWLTAAQDPEKQRERQIMRLRREYFALQNRRSKLQNQYESTTNQDKKNDISVELALTLSAIAGVRKALSSLNAFV